LPKTEIYENDCEKLKSLADEYLHDELILCGDFDSSWELELSGEDRGFVDRHLGECAGCHAFIESESRYKSGMVQAAYAPEKSVFGFVADKIRRENIAIEKPKKRIIVPFGLLSAAAVVLAVFLVSRGGLLDAFMKSGNQGKAANEAADEAGGFTPATGMEFGTYPERSEADMAGGADGEHGELEMADSPEAETAEDVYYAVAEADEAPPPVAAAPPAPAEEAAPAPAPEPAAKPEWAGDFGAVSDAEFWEANFELAIEWLYRVDVAGGDILKGIEVHRADPEGRFYVIAIKYKDILDKNIGDNNISAEVAGAYNPNAAETGEKYIGIVVRH